MGSDLLQLYNPTAAALHARPPRNQSSLTPRTTHPWLTHGHSSSPTLAGQCPSIQSPQSIEEAYNGPWPNLPLHHATGFDRQRTGVLQTGGNSGCNRGFTGSARHAKTITITG